MLAWEKTLKKTQKSSQIYYSFPGVENCDKTVNYIMILRGWEISIKP